MKIGFSAEDLTEVFNSLKFYIDKSNTRPIQGNIQLVCEKGFCVATALDGYKAMMIQVPFYGDDGTMIVPIVKIPKKISKKISKVTIEETETEIQFDFGTEKTIVPKPEGCFLDLTGKFKTDDSVYSIGFDPKLMKEALEGFTAGSTIEMKFKSPLQGCVIKCGNRTALVLPKRLKNEN